MPRIKTGVVLYEMHPKIAEVIRPDGPIDRITQRIKGRRAYITSARDGDHSANSKHYYGRAVDLRNRDMSQTQKEEYERQLKAALGPDFFVLTEKTHVHIQYNGSDSDL